MTARVDIAGVRYGKSVAIERAGYHVYPSGQKQLRWLCLCDCGNEFYTTAGSLRNGDRSSCVDCSSKSRIEKMRKPDQHIKYMLSYYLRNAEKRNLEFSLTLEDVRALISGDCFYCGAAPRHGSGCAKRLFHDAVPANGIDRVDSNRGYIFNNCVSCCFDCNRSKGNRTVEEFVSWAKRLIGHYESR